MKKTLPTIDMTPAEYAGLRQINVSHVRRYCKAAKPLPGVASVKRFGRFFILRVYADFS